MSQVMRMLQSLAGAMVIVLMAASCAPLAEGPEQTLNNQQVREMDARLDVGLVVASDGKPRLKITESFIMGQDTILVRLPVKFLRKERLYDRIENLTVSKGATLSPYPGYDFVKKIEYKKGERLVLSYLYRPDDPVNYKVDKESPSAPIIRNNYLQFIGGMVLIFPVGIDRTNEEFALSINWSTPADFRVFDSYNAQRNSTKIVTNYDKLRDALFVAGNNMRVHDVVVRGQPVTITLEGVFPKIPDNEFVDVASRLLETQRATWNDDNFPYFLIHFLAKPSVCNGGTLLGTAHPNSFRAVLPDQCTFQPSMKQLISHELMHMWIGKKIKVGEQEGHYDGKWFTEGWTDYYGRLLAYRAGVLTEDQYFETLNRHIEKYYLTDERTVTLKELVSRFYKRGSNKELEGVPYQQGEIMAWRLNKDIKEKTLFKNSLDDVVRDMLKIAELSGGVKNFKPEEIGAVIDKYDPGALREELDKIVNGGLFIPPELPRCRQPYKTPSSINYSRVVLSYGPRMRDCSPWLN